MIASNSSGSLTPGTGCSTVSPSSVSCPYSAASKPVIIDLAMGDGFDSATIDTSVSSSTTTVATDIGDFIAGMGPVIVDATDAYGTLFGGPYGDFLDLVSGSAEGGGGNDKIQLYGGGGSVTGGDGDDHVDASGATQTVDYEASDGDDVFIGGSGDDEIVLGWGNDLAFGGPGNDRFYDNAGGPEEEPGDNDSEVWAGPGDDIFTDWNVAVAQMHYDGGPGQDVVTYLNASAPTTPVSISMDDVADDGVSGEHDHVHQSVEIVGTHPALGTSQMKGSDTLVGSAADNLLNGRNGNDTINGAGGDDELVGESGADLLIGGPGSDELTGGSGTDTASYSTATLPVSVSLAITIEQDTVGAGLDTLSSIQDLVGGPGGDTLTGDGSANTITGGAGADTISAGDGADTIHAADGVVDSVTCGAGTDTANVDAGDSVSGCETVNVL